MRDGNSSVYRFGPFSIDEGERMLRADGEIVVLPPRVFETLFLLVSRHGQLLTKREMLDAIWKDAFVEEGNLTQNIYLLRRTLGKAPDGKDWIETLPRKGYVFAGEVSVADLFEEKAMVDQQPKAVPKRWFRFKTAAGLVAVGILIAAALFVYSSYRPRETTAAARNVSLDKITFSGNIEFPVISPDGRSFAFVREKHLFVQTLGSEAPTEIALPPKMDVGFLQFTPDSQSIAFRDQARFYLAGNIQKVPVGGGKPEMLGQNVWSGFGFSPDGHFVAFVRDSPDKNRHAVVIKDLEKGEERTLGELAGPSRFILIGSPAWSPDATKIAIATSRQEAQLPRSQLSVYNVADGSVEEYAPSPLKQFEQAIWRPNGRSIAVIARESQKFFQVWELSYPQGRPTRITNDLNIYRGLSLSTDGQKMLSANYTTFSHVWIADAADLNSQRQLTNGNLNRDGTIGITWLPDQSLVYSSRVFGNVDLWRVGPRDIDRTQLTREAGEGNGNPQISPDGKALYFTSNRTGTTQIWRMDRDGGGQTQVTFGEKEVNTFPQISPDGQWLYYVRNAKNETAIRRRSIASGIDETLATNGKLAPEKFLEISPDGKFLATCDLTAKSDENAETRLFRIAIVSTGQAETPRFFNLPSEWITWSPESGSFDYAENANGDSRIWRQSIDGGEPRLLVELMGDHVAQLAWSPDGTKLAISKGKRLNDAIILSNF